MNFERRVTFAMVASDDFLKCIELHWCDELIPSPEMMRICHWALKHHEACGKAPRQDVEDVYLKGRRNMPRAEAELIVEILREVYNHYREDWDAAVAAIVTNHLLDDTVEWLRRRARKQRLGSIDDPDERGQASGQLSSLKEMLWRDPTLHLPSRLAWYKTEMSSRSKRSYAKRETMMEEMFAGALRDVLPSARRRLRPA